MLRSILAALSTISVRLQQFIDEESAIPTSTTAIQGATFVGSIAAFATAVMDQHPVLSIPASQVETLSQPEPTFLILDSTHTEVQAVVDHCPIDTLLEE